MTKVLKKLRMTSFLLTPSLKIVSNNFSLPPLDQMRIGDIVVVRYKNSNWAPIWEDWHHAGLITKIDPLTIIEAVGIENTMQPTGPFEVLFDQSVGFGKKTQNSIMKIKFLHPIFPHPIREIDKKEVPQSKRKIISEEEARKRVVEYAKKQIGEPYAKSISNKRSDNDTVTKWDENEWYCSLLVYKSYSRTITGMRLENSPAGPLVTPEDLVESPRTQTYFMWTRQTMLTSEVYA